MRLKQYCMQLHALVPHDYNDCVIACLLDCPHAHTHTHTHTHTHSYVGRANLTEVYLVGVGDALSAHSAAEAKGIKAHFRMDESGLLLLDNVRIMPFRPTAHSVCVCGLLQESRNSHPLSNDGPVCVFVLIPCYVHFELHVCT